MSRFCGAAAPLPIVLVLALGPVYGQYVEGIDSDQLRPAEEPAAPTEEIDLEEVRQLIIEQTNELRREQGLPTLDPNGQLGEAAQDFAQFIAETGNFGHTADGSRPSERAAEAGYEYCIVLENLGAQYSAQGFTTEQSAQRFMTGWKDSEGHYENLVDPDIREIGVGIARGESGHYIAVQKFGRPRQDEISFTVLNRAGAEVHYRLVGKGNDNVFTLPADAEMQHARCRPPKIQLIPDEDQPRAVSDEAAVESGDQFVISGEPGDLRLRRVENGAP